MCFNHVTDYKEIRLLEAEFHPSEEDEVKQHIKFRHKVANIELAQVQAKLELMCKSIKEKNPSLIKHICREVQKERPWGEPLNESEIRKAKKSGGATSRKSARSGNSNKTRATTRKGTSVASMQI